MQSSPKVSVLIPVLNRAKYISSAIKSVQKQTYQNVEIIVVDGGSTDGTLDVLEEMGVDYLKLNERGIAKARNFAVKHSVGEFFCGCDSDDMLHPRYVEETLKPMRDHRVGFVWTSCRGFGDATYINYSKPFVTRLSAYRFPGGQIGCAMMRRIAYDDVGGYDESTLLHEDSDIMIRISRRWKCKAVREPLYYYRVHGNQLVNIESKYNTTEEYLYRRYPIHIAMKIISPLSERITHPRRTLKRLNECIVNGKLRFSIRSG